MSTVPVLIGDASGLEDRGVEITRGDMLDLDSLTAAMTGADPVSTTAPGHNPDLQNRE